MASFTTSQCIINIIYANNDLPFHFETPQNIALYGYIILVSFLTKSLCISTYIVSTLSL